MDLGCVGLHGWMSLFRASVCAAVGVRHHQVPSSVGGCVVLQCSSR